MSDLIVKEVNFNGDNLLAVQDTAKSKIYVGVKWICDSLGMDARRQREKIQEHMTLSKGVSTLPLPSSGGTQETLVLEIDFLPLWLATINPTLVNTRAQGKLVEYQLKAKDVLAQEFLGQAKLTCVEDLIIMQAKSLKDIRLQLQETRQEVSATKETIVNIKGAVIPEADNWREWVNQQLNKIVDKIGNRDRSKYQEVRSDSYKLLEQRGSYDLSRRLVNLKGRMLEEGATKTRINGLSKLDVIESEPRLKEIYTKVIQDMVIKYLA